MNKNKILSILGTHFNFPGSQKIIKTIGSFSITEKFAFYTFATLLCLSALLLTFFMSRNYMVTIPTHGGTLREGIISAPAHFINPIFTITEADRDLSALIYSGLLKPDPKGGLTTDLAASYSVSTDGKTYTFILKDNLTFHDGTPLTTDDIEFTIHKIQDSAVKSPRRANWDKVIVNIVSEKEIQFTTPEKLPYAPFLTNLTLGILPKHIWKDVSIDAFPLSSYNISPIGSGPYMIKSIAREKDVPTSYTLKPFAKYVHDTAHISTLEIYFYQNEEDAVSAYKNGDIDSLGGISPAKAEELKKYNGNINVTPLPRIFGVFFNQNKSPVLANKEVRQAFEVSLDREKIVQDVLLGYGESADGPIPPGLIDIDIAETSASTTDRIADAKKILADAGWKVDTTDGLMKKTVNKKQIALQLDITTPDIPDLKKVAGIIKETWEKVGAKVNVTVYEIGNLQQDIITPRKYDALLFGEVVGRDLDLYAFWHSSQRNSPGLNVAMYVNLAADKLLEQARQTSDSEELIAIYKKFEKEIAKDNPAVFIYSPDFIYIMPKKIQGSNIGKITLPSERFASISDWFIQTDTVWKIFADKEKIIGQK
ncbi:MAG: ABC transporter substrate-binding protein [Candidatus Paceibacterota bacterium]